MMTNEQAKNTYLVRRDLDCENRHFVYTDNVNREHVKVFNYVNSDAKLLEFARDSFGMISDCYIMYAIAHLGVAEKETILLFLQAVHLRNPQLNIVCEEKGVLTERLRVLSNMGYVFKHRYEVIADHGMGPVKELVTLYSLSEDAYNMVKQKLQKRININAAIQMKPIKELIGWACAGYVGSMIAKSSTGFSGFLERVLRTKQLGSAYMPCELKTQVGEEVYYISVLSSYFGIDPSYQTKRDYDECCAFKVNMIRNYLCCRTTKGLSVVVVAVADNADLNEITYCIHNTGALVEFYGRIYFTGEGVLRFVSDVENAFLQMYCDEESERGYDIRQVKAPFIG